MTACQLLSERNGLMMRFDTDENQVEKIEGMTIAYPYCMHQRDLTDIVIPWHWHEELELGYLERGASRIRTVNREYIIQEGEGFFINSNVMDMKSNASPGNPALEINHIFHPVFLSGHFKSLFETKYLNPLIQNRQIEVHILRNDRQTSSRILSNLKKLKNLQKRSDTEFATRNLLSESWMLLLEDIKKTQPSLTIINIESQNRLRSMLAFIHSHYHEKITLADIAVSANISEREALRCFQKNLNQSPFEYLIGFRLNQSKKLLAGTYDSITQISFMCGFSNSAYFGKVFKKAFGMTPLAYHTMVKNVSV